MGRLLAGFLFSLVALAAFSVLLYGAPIIGAIGPMVGSAILIAILLAHLWARERREAKG